MSFTVSAPATARIGAASFVDREPAAKRLIATVSREKIQASPGPDAWNALGLDHPRAPARREPGEVARRPRHLGHRGTVGDAAHDVRRLVRRVPRTATLAGPKRGHL